MNERWLIDLILLFIPSTAPLESRIWVHARTPSRWVRSGEGSRPRMATHHGPRRDADGLFALQLCYAARRQDRSRRLDSEDPSVRQVGPRCGVTSRSPG